MTFSGVNISPVSKFLSGSVSTFLFLFLFFSIFPISPFPEHHAQAGLYDAVSKYQDTEVDEVAIARLSPYDKLIDYFSSLSYVSPRRTVHPHFIRALILAESGGRADAVSTKNAIGLGQIRYPTGRQAAKALASSSQQFNFVSKQRLATLTRDDLFDPAINILLTCYLVSRYNNQFDGHLDLVVSAWNAGENTPSLLENKHAPYAETESLIV